MTDPDPTQGKASQPHRTGPALLEQQKRLAREAAALRANLHRRKSQNREGQGDATPRLPPPPSPG